MDSLSIQPHAAVVRQTRRERRPGQDAGQDGRHQPGADSSKRPEATHEPEPASAHPAVPGSAAWHGALGELAIDPEGGAVINRENDIGRPAEPGPHPDQALLRLRAYRPPRDEAGTAQPGLQAGPHANIEA